MPRCKTRTRDENICCNSSNNNNNHDNACVSKRTIICYLISTIIISVIIYFLVLSYSRSLIRLDNLENDIQEIMKSLSGSSDCDAKTDSMSCDGAVQQTQSYTKEEIEQYIKHCTEGLRNELAATKKQIDTVVNRLSCGKKDNQISEMAPVNYAAETLGATIEYVEDNPFYTQNLILQFFGFHYCNTPVQVLKPIIFPGNCYAFRGDKSTVVINLARDVIVTSVSIEHILDTMSPSGDISNAPKDFEVYGIASKKSRDDKPLGRFSYDIHRHERIQYFQILNKCPFNLVKFNFLSNHGHKTNTCIYRIGIHGTLQTNDKANR